MTECRLCECTLKPFLDFGPMPLSSRFPAPDDTDAEYRFPLVAALCEHCGLVQLAHHVAPELMFNDGYTFFSSSSQRMAAHFGRFADWTLQALSAKAAPFVVEIGCNDGTMLSAFARGGARALGVEPSGNSAEMARERGLHVITEFFDEQISRQIASQHGRADAIVAANCICHIPDICSLLRAVRNLLAPDGLFVFEDPYWPDILRRRAFDQIYDEHVFYFSATSVDRMARRHGLTLLECHPMPVHGGSMRYVLVHTGRRRPNAAVSARLQTEARADVAAAEGCQAFAAAADKVRETLPALLRTLRAEGAQVAGYAATAKSSTLLNYCGIDRTLLPWICDTTPQKQGRLSPGARIPVVSHQTFARKPPDVALLLAWNHAAEIMAKERDFAARGGRWIIHVPRLRILASNETFTIDP